METSKVGCCAPVRSDSPGGCCGEVGTLEATAPPATPLGNASVEGMVRLAGGSFLMGGEGPEIWESDGEGPVREVTLKPFWIDATCITNRQFEKFVAATGYVTEAERFGWSFVHASQLSNHKRKMIEPYRVAGLEWWYRVDGSDWRHPIDPKEDIGRLERWDHPVVHVTWNDAVAYGQWCGKRLPTEAEWEFACRGGLAQKIYPWGDELTPGGKHRCNIWQGEFPKHDRGDDGYKGTAPARSFKPNGYGLYNMTGNVWEWVNDWFTPRRGQVSLGINAQQPIPASGRTIRGGSYLCHRSYCNRYRCSARSSNTPDSSAGHHGFRCALD